MEYLPPLHLGVVAIEKGAFGSPSTKVANFTYFIGWGPSFIIAFFFNLDFSLSTDGPPKVTETELPCYLSISWRVREELNLCISSGH